MRLACMCFSLNLDQPDTLRPPFEASFERIHRKCIGSTRTCCNASSARFLAMMFEPFGNTTVLPPKHWHSEPLRRGTFNILSSCLITMSLCIWTSLHLNLPEYKKKHLQTYRKTCWMIIGLLAPELFVWNAWQQRQKAKEISALMQDVGFMLKRRKTWIVRAWQKTPILLLLKAEDLPGL